MRDCIDRAHCRSAPISITLTALGSKLPAIVSVAMNGPAGLLEDDESEQEEDDECMLLVGFSSWGCGISSRLPLCLLMTNVSRLFTILITITNIATTCVMMIISTLLPPMITH